MKFVRFTYKGDKWIAYIVPNDEMGDFVEDATDNTLAEVQWFKKEVYFSNHDDSIKLETILHELFHIAAGYHHVQNCNLDYDQAEEFFCDLFAIDGEEVLKLGKELEKYLVRLRKSTNKNMELTIKNG